MSISATIRSTAATLGVDDHHIEIMTTPVGPDKTLGFGWFIESRFETTMDAKILDDPNGQIIQKGGRIFFARVRGKVAEKIPAQQVGDGAPF